MDYAHPYPTFSENTKNQDNFGSEAVEIILIFGNTFLLPYDWQVNPWI
jgi:hypothetical protein